MQCCAERLYLCTAVAGAAATITIVTDSNSASYVHSAVYINTACLNIISVRCHLLQELLQVQVTGATQLLQQQQPGKPHIPDRHLSILFKGSILWCRLAVSVDLTPCFIQCHLGSWCSVPAREASENLGQAVADHQQLAGCHTNAPLSCKMVRAGSAAL